MNAQNAKTDFGPSLLSRLLWGIHGLTVYLLTIKLPEYLDVPWFVGLVPGLVWAISGALLLMKMAQRAAHRHQTKRQAARDAEADSVIASLHNEAQEPSRRFFLYLRPFSSTGELGSFQATAGGDAFLFPPDYDFETLLTQALIEQGPLIALGEPGEHFGAGRILSSESEWQNMFKTLAQSAELIFTLPAGTSSILWELKWLETNNKMRKVIFFMPPSQVEGGASVAWDQARTQLKGLGIGMPPYQTEGLFFRIKRGGANELKWTWDPNATAEALTFNADQLRKVIEKVSGVFNLETERTADEAKRQA